VGMERPDPVRIHGQLAAGQLGGSSLGEAGDQHRPRAEPLDGPADLTGQVGRLTCPGWTENPVFGRETVVPIADLFESTGGPAEGSLEVIEASSLPLVMERPVVDDQVYDLLLG